MQRILEALTNPDSFLPYLGGMRPKKSSTPGGKAAQARVRSARKTKPPRSTSRLVRTLYVPDCDTADELQSFLGNLERAIATRPREIVLRFVGVSQMAPDPALLLHHILHEREPGILLRTEALSPIVGPGVLLWLAGDVRTMRPNTWLYMMKTVPGTRRRSVPRGVAELEAWQGGETDPTPPQPRLVDYDFQTVLDLVNQFLPVNELGDRPITPGELREFGLIGGERFDAVLAAAFRGDVVSADLCGPGPHVGPTVSSRGNHRDGSHETGGA